MADGGKNAPGSLMCPSAPMSEGAIILGEIGGDGSVDYIRDRTVVSAEFMEIASRGRTPGQRFRFSSPCQESACGQWKSGGCSLPDRLSEIIPATETSNTLPLCSIRSQCRWFHQQGKDAFHICPLVVTRDGPSQVKNTETDKITASGEK